MRMLMSERASKVMLILLAGLLVVGIILCILATGMLTGAFVITLWACFVGGTPSGVVVAFMGAFMALGCIACTVLGYVLGKVNYALKSY